MLYACAHVLTQILSISMERLRYDYALLSDMCVQVTGHCSQGQLQTITVFDPMPGNTTGVVSAM